MKNRVSDYLGTPIPSREKSSASFPEQVNAAQEELVNRKQQIERAVGKHPLTGVGAAFAFGILIGWVIKRR